MKHKSWDKEIWLKIEAALKTQQKLEPGKAPIAAFDADGTLWNADLGESFFQFQIREKLLPQLPNAAWEHYRNWKEMGDPRPAYLWLAQINQGLSLKEVQGWAQKAVEEKMPLPIFQDMHRLVEFLHKEGVQVYVVTASVKWAVEPGAALLGIRKEQVLGVSTLVNHKGLVTDQAAHVLPYREGKAELLLKVTGDQRPFLAAGNTMGDFALLQSASQVALACTSSQSGHELFDTESELQDEARKRGWLRHRY